MLHTWLLLRGLRRVSQNDRDLEAPLSGCGVDTPTTTLIVPKHNNTLIAIESMAATTMRLSCTFLDLSTELIIEILSHLPASDLLSVQRTCHTTHDIITGTAYLQYILRSHIHGVGDFLPPDFPHSERLELLQRHERSRKALRFDFLTECVAHMPYSDRFTLRDGYLIYESLTASTPQYGYTNLSSGARNEEVRWVHITMDKSRLPLPLKIIFAPDHDLVAAIRFVSFPLPF